MWGSWGSWHVTGGLDNHLETMLYYLDLTHKVPSQRSHLTHKFRTGYLYFPNNFKHINDHIQADMISFKVFFQLMVTVFKEKLNLQQLLILYSSIRFVFETAFISDHIVENRLGAVSEISDKFITRFNVFSNMILQFRLKTVWKISKPYSMTLKTMARQFCLRGHSLYHKIQGSTSRNEKDLK